MLTPGVAGLMGVLLESLGYGMFFVLFAYNMYLQIRNFADKNTNRPNMLLLASSTLLFALITSRWALGAARLYEAVVDLEGRLSLNRYFADITMKKEIANTALFEFQVIVADFILIYRLYYVWKPHWWICVPPALAWIAQWISTTLLLWSMTHANLAAGVFQSRVERWITSSFASTISNNIYCSVAIIVRLRSRHSAIVEASQDSQIWRALRIFVESASLLTIFLTAAFISFLAGSNIQYTLVDVTSPVIGISFLLILLRLNMNRHGQNSASRDTTSQRGTTNSYPLRSINITVAQNVDADSDLEGKSTGKRPYDDMA